MPEAHLTGCVWTPKSVYYAERKKVHQKYLSTPAKKYTRIMFCVCEKTCCAANLVLRCTQHPSRRVFPQLLPQYCASATASQQIYMLVRTPTEVVILG